MFFATPLNVSNVLQWRPPASLSGTFWGAPAPVAGVESLSQPPQNGAKIAFDPGREARAARCAAASSLQRLTFGSAFSTQGSIKVVEKLLNPDPRASS